MAQVLIDSGIAAIAVCVLVGWWLAVRPGSSYRGIASSMSCLIVILSVLLCILALRPMSAAANPPSPGRSFQNAPAVPPQP